MCCFFLVGRAEGPGDSLVRVRVSFSKRGPAIASGAPCACLPVAECFFYLCHATTLHPIQPYHLLFYYSTRPRRVRLLPRRLHSPPLRFAPPRPHAPCPMPHPLHLSLPAEASSRLTKKLEFLVAWIHGRRESLCSSISSSRYSGPRRPRR